MTKKGTLVVLLIMALFIISFWWFLKPETSQIESTDVRQEELPEVEITVIDFVSPQTNERVSVEFTSENAVLNGAGYEGVIMSRVESASGAKYSDGQDNISVWNKGEELTVYVGEEAVFVGQTEASLGNPNPGLETLSEVNIYGTWNWLETSLADGSKISPEQLGIFTLILTESGDLSATTDCNSISGQFSIQENSLSVGPLAMTMMFCEDSQETDFIAPINGTLRFDLNGEMLSLTSGDGATLVFTKE